MLSASAFVSADTLTSTLIIPDITKTSSNNCLKSLDYQSSTYPKAKSRDILWLIIQTLSQKKKMLKLLQSNPA